MKKIYRGLWKALSYSGVREKDELELTRLQKRRFRVERILYMMVLLQRGGRRPEICQTEGWKPL